MAIRLPINIASFTTAASETGGGSVAGGIQFPFQIPFDTDSIVVKFTSSVVSGGYSAVLQTSDDGGTTYYDVGRTSVVTNANNTTAEWLAATVIGSGGVNPQVLSTVNANSVLGGSIGSAAASSLGNRQVSGLPILGIQNRIFMRITGNITNAASNTATATVYANSQSASHN